MEHFLNQNIIYDHDIFIDKNIIEIFFTNTVSTSKMYKFMVDLFQKNGIFYNMEKENAVSFSFSILKDKERYKLNFKRSKFF